MTLLEQAAQLHNDGRDREAIASELCLTRQMVDWIMDSDSFTVILSRVSGDDRADTR